MNKCTTFFFLSFLFLRPNHTCGQIAINDSLALQKSIEYTTEIYRQAFREESNIYNGIEYTEFSKKIKGSPYFEANDWTNGSVFYEGALYSNIPMLYDMVNDLVVIKDYNGAIKIRLASEQLEYFNLLNHHFIRMEGKSLSDTSLLSGFYDLRANGEVKVYVKRFKTIFEATTSSDIEREYIGKSTIYIYKQKKYYPVSSKSSVLKILKDRKKELSRFLRDNKIRFASNRENAIIKMVEHYNH